MNNTNKVISDLSNIVSISGDPISNEIPDIVFFKKSQIKEGVALVNYGRRNPQGKKWIVKRILHFYSEAPSNRNHWEGRLRHRRVPSPETLMDAIVIHCEDGSQMELTFQYLSYSAIWRLV